MTWTINRKPFVCKNKHSSNCEQTKRKTVCFEHNSLEAATTISTMRKVSFIGYLLECMISETHSSPYWISEKCKLINIRALCVYLRNIIEFLWFIKTTLCGREGRKVSDVLNLNMTAETKHFAPMWKPLALLLKTF